MRGLVALISVFAALLACLPAGAAEAFPDIPPPVLLASEKKEEDGDITYCLRFSSAAPAAEKRRSELRAGSADKNSRTERDTSAFSYKTVNICLLYTDGSVPFPVKTLSADESRAEISLIKDILPSIRSRTGSTEKYAGGFGFSLRLVTASENYNGTNADELFVCSEPSEGAGFSSPAFGTAVYDLPVDAVNSQSNPEFFLLPLKSGLSLSAACRAGYIFDGWSAGGETRVGKIPAGTVKISLVSHWLPKTYAINYVLTTNTEHDFGRTDNRKNPVSYIHGSARSVFPVSSPVRGWFFGGWFLNGDFSGEAVKEIPADSVGDVILYARWKSAKEVEAEERQLKEELIKAARYGDINGDGRVSAADARLVLRAVVGLEKIPDSLLKRADYYGSGIITAGNARITLRAAVGLDSLYDILTRNGVI